MHKKYSVAIILTIVISSLFGADTIDAFANPSSHRHSKKRSHSTATKTSAPASADYRPLKAMNFITEPEEMDPNDEDWMPSYTTCEIDPDFMRSAGFTRGKNKRWIRPDVTVWETFYKENGDTLEGCIFLKFSTVSAAKDFMKTCEELDWEYEENDSPDCRHNHAPVCTVSVCRDGATVAIDWDNT